MIKAVTSNCTTDLPSWRATSTIAQCAHLYNTIRTEVTIAKAPRKALQEPHILANWARQSGQSFQGLTGESNTVNQPIATSIDMGYFKFD